MKRSSYTRSLAISLIASCAVFASGCGGCDGDPEPDLDMAKPGADMPADMVRDLADKPDADEADMPLGDMPSGDMPADMTPDMDIVITPQTPDQEKLLAVPRTETWKFEGLSAPAHVIYTEMGRPHVYAENRDDMGYVLGFIVARDRFFLMDLQRRLAQGKLSELLGDSAIANDVESRNTGMDQVTQLLLDNLPDDEARYMDSYVLGINAYIEAVGEGKAKPPSELVPFKFLLGASKEVDLMKPFTRRDVAAMVAVIMYETNFETSDVGRTATFARLDSLYRDPAVPFNEARRAGALQDIWEGGISPLYEAHSVSGWTVEQGTSGANGALPAPRKPGLNGKKPAPLNLNVELLERSNARLTALSERLGKRELDNFGSNTWAVAGSHTADGSGLVAGDGHLPLDLPSLMYQIGLDTKTFGDSGDMRQTGLLITSLPILAVGTNGDVAWSQVNPFADIVDWYAEEIELGADGLPTATRFQGESKPVEIVQETYEIADVPALDSVGRTEVIARYKTFDGRLIFDIEGESFTKETLPEGVNAYFNGTDYIAPVDTNGDGIISAVSFDYTAFDTTKYISTLQDLSLSKSVEEYRQRTKGFIGNMLYSAATDKDGNILFTSYQAVPCRGYLAREGDGSWSTGAHPAMLLDGTTYGGFTIPSNEDGTVNEVPGQDDPYKCVVPFDETPQAVNPDSGYVFNGNNQPAPITTDSSLSNDPWYIGGPWRAVRGDSIEQNLAQVAGDKSASVEGMALLQAERRSRTGEMFLDHFLNAVDRAKALSPNPGGSPSEVRLIALYQANEAAFDEVATRLGAWRDAGFNTDSGVDTFYNTSSEQTRANAVATMIFNAWMPRVMQDTFGDETLAYYTSSSVVNMRVLKRMLDGREGNSTNLASYDPMLGESAFFDVLGTTEVEQSDEVILGALVNALTFLSAESAAPGEGGFGTDDMSQWLWGLRHQSRFASILGTFFAGTDFDSAIDQFSITTEVLPLAPDLTEDDPRFGIKWFPRPGDNFAVDAANPGFSGSRFTHGSGPVMRMVISLKDGEVKGQNIIPGGQSALNDSDNFADQVQMWLNNTTIPLRYTPEEVAEGGVRRALFVP